MVYRRERPRCRKLILNLLENENLTLEELLHHKTIFLSNNLKRQAKKMIAEGEFRSGLEIWRDERKEFFERAVGMIK